MTMGQPTWRLLKYRPGIFLATIFFRGIDDVAPFLAGVIMKGFFDALTGQAEAGFTAWTLVALFVAVEVGGDDAAHDAQRQAGAKIVHDITASFSGSISAEHGLGAMKSAEALRYKAAVEVNALRAIRAALDPKRIMNPRVHF